MKTYKDLRAGVITESPVDGVAKGALEGDKHMCASKIMHKEWKEVQQKVCTVFTWDRQMIFSNSPVKNITERLNPLSQKNIYLN